MEVDNRVFAGRIIFTKVHMRLSRWTQFVVGNRFLDAFLN